MTPQLTSGTVARLMALQPGTAHEDFQPILQLLSVKKRESSRTGNTSGYQLVFSDGEYYCYSILATKLNDYFLSQNFTRRYIVRLTRYSMHPIRTRRVLLILGIDKVQEYSKKVGDPVNFMKVARFRPTNTLPIGFNPPCPIEYLSLYSITTIRARVTQKSDIRTWSNQHAQGKLFRVHLTDESGEIHGTAYDEAVDNLYSKLEVGKIYWFSGASTILASRPLFSLSSPHQYELAFYEHTEVVPCEDESAMPRIQFNLAGLSQSDTIKNDPMVDGPGTTTEAEPTGVSVE